MIKKSEALWLLLNRELSEEQFCQSADEIEYNGNMSFFLISILIECTESEPNSIADKIQKTVFNILESENKGANCRISNRDFVALAYTKAAYSQISMLKQRYSIVQRIQSELEIISGCMVSLGVSDPCYDLKKIKTMFSEAQNSLGKRIFLGKGKILYYDNFRNLIGNTNVELLNTRMAKIQENLELKQQQQLLHEIDNIYNIDLRGIMQYNYLQHVNALLLGMLIFTCKQNGIPINKIFPNGSVPMDLLEELETADEIRGWFMERFSVLFDTSNNVGNLQSYHQTDKFITYMQQNYTKDISLESIATNFGIHKVYLAKIFKDKLGKSVNGYIRELRIEKAMELLRTSNYNISDIVHMVGFNNAQSFYIIFGRIAGVTPKEYRDGIDSRAKLRTLK
jgi:two-component system response regulator YesN